MARSINLSLFEDAKDAIDLSWQKEVFYKIISTKEDFLGLISKLSLAKVIALDTETTERFFKTEKLVGISLCVDVKEAYYIPLNHLRGECLPSSFVLARLGLLLKDKKVIMHNAKFDMEFLKQHGDIDIESFDDTMLMAHFLDTNQDLGLKKLVKKYLHVDMVDLDMVMEGCKSFGELDTQDAYMYACSDADCTLRLYNFLLPHMEQYSFLYTIELKVLKVLMQMEMRGILTNKEYFENLNISIIKQIGKLKIELYKAMGVGVDSINLNSSQQLADILYNKLGIKPLQKTKGGQNSVSEKAISMLADDYPVVKLLSDYKALEKLKNTFIDAVRERTLDSVMHFSILQSHVKSSRMASARVTETIGMNVQQVPKGETLGVSIRKGFIPRKGYKFLSADFNQIELRIYASLAGINKLLDYFEQGVDAHSATAALMLVKDARDVTEKDRAIGKTMNFALLYGGGAGAVSSSLKIPQKDAYALIDQYFEAIPEAKLWMDKQKRDVHTNGYITNCFNRVMHVKNSNPTTREAQSSLERSALNLPIQSAAADIFKMALCKLHKNLKSYLDDKTVFFVIPIHDEIILEVREDVDLEKLCPIIKDSMEIKLGKTFAPIKVAISVGNTWGELEKYGAEKKPKEIVSSAEADNLQKFLKREGHVLTHGSV